MSKIIKCMRCGKEIEVHPQTWRAYCEDCKREVYANNPKLRNSAKYRKTDKGKITKRKSEVNGNATKKYALKVYNNPERWSVIREKSKAYAAHQRKVRYADRYKHQTEVLNTIDTILGEVAEREKNFFELRDSYTNRHLRCDAYYPQNNLIVEVNGAQHYIPIRFGNISEQKAQENLLDYQRRDRIKQKYCLEHNIRYVVIPYTVAAEDVADYLFYQLEHQDIVRITKQFKFAYAHRLESPLLDDESNRELFGKCNNYNYHGHNARLQVELKGLVDPLSGMVINFKTLKMIVNNVLDKYYDHKNLNQDLEHFEQAPSTCENTLAILWNELQKDLILLDTLTMYEEDDSFCTYKGGR